MAFGALDDGAGKERHLCTLAVDAVLSHRGHAVGVEVRDDIDHLVKIIFCKGDSFGVGNGLGLAHGGDEAAVLLAVRKSAPVRAAIYHARLVDAYVHHQLCPHTSANILLNHMGDTGALKQAGDVFNNARLGVRRRA